MQKKLLCGVDEVMFEVQNVILFWKFMGKTKITQRKYRENTGNFLFWDEWEPCDLCISELAILNLNFSNTKNLVTPLCVFPGHQWENGCSSQNISGCGLWLCEWGILWYLTIITCLSVQYLVLFTWGKWYCLRRQPRAISFFEGK